MRGIQTFVLGNLFLLLPCSVASADDWPYWMGPQKDGVWREEGIVQKLPEELNKLWSVPINGGYSGPAVAGENLFVMDFEKAAEEPAIPGRLSKVTGTERVLCLNRQTGEERWAFSYETELKVSYPGGPRITPFVEGDSVYAQGTMGKTVCLDVETGDVKWEFETTERYETKPPIWGYAAHPLIVGDTLFCMAGGDKSGVVALDKRTGKEKWAAVTAQEIGYAPFVAATICNKQQLVVWYDVALVGLDLENGQTLWEYKFPQEKPQRPIVSIVPPKVIDNQIFITNFYHGSALVEVSNEDNGFGVRELWSTEKTRPVKGYKPEINSIMSSLVQVENGIVGVAGNGELRCVDLPSSDVLWRSYQALATAEEDPQELPRGFKGFASMFLTPHQDQHWLFTDQGELIQAKLSRSGYEELGRVKLLETTGSTRGRDYVWCHPAYAHGCIFVRNEKEIACFDLKSASYR